GEGKIVEWLGQGDAVDFGAQGPCERLDADLFVGHAASPHRKPRTFRSPPDMASATHRSPPRDSENSAKPPTTPRPAGLTALADEYFLKAIIRLRGREFNTAVGEPFDVAHLQEHVRRHCGLANLSPAPFPRPCRAAVAGCRSTRGGRIRARLEARARRS